MMANEVKSAEAFLDEFGGETDYWKAQLYKTREEWERGRKDGWDYCGQHYRTYGASDVPIIAGVSSFMSREQFFRICTGREKHEHKENEQTMRGHCAEPHIRALWALEHPDFDVWDGTGIIFRSKRRTHMHASLDCIVRERTTGKFAALEIKHYHYSREWKDGGCPVQIFVQVLAQAYVLGWSDMRLIARLICPWGSSMECEHHWELDTDAAKLQIAAMCGDVDKFASAVLNNEPPAPRLAL